MRTLIDLVGDLGAGRSRGAIYARTPFAADSPAVVHDPWSVLGPPDDLAPFLDADLAHEYLRAWSGWQPTRPSPEAAVDALIAFAARPLAEVRQQVSSLPELRVSTAMGRTYNDPSDELLLHLMAQVETGRERFFLIERLSDPSGETYTQVMRQSDGTYVVEHRDGSPESHRSEIAGTTAAALLLLKDWTSIGARSLREDAAPAL